MKSLWRYFWVHHKPGLVLGVISLRLASSLEVNVQNGDYFWAPKISNIFLGGMPVIPDRIFGVSSRCRVQAYV